MERTAVVAHYRETRHVLRAAVGLLGINETPVHLKRLARTGLEAPAAAPDRRLRLPKCGSEVHVLQYVLMYSLTLVRPPI